MIDIDVARRLQGAGLSWDPADGDWFVIDNQELRDELFMLSSMVIERGVGRTGAELFRFNGTTEWALDSVEQHEALWVPRADQLLTALGAAFRSLEQGADGGFAVRFGPAGAEPREVRAPHAEDALAGALLVQLSS